MGKSYALKVVELGEESTKELDAIQAICRTQARNSHVITIYEIWHLEVRNPLETMICPVIKMELCDGTLDSYLKSFRETGSSISSQELVEIVMHTLTGLTHCHTLHYCHRDLKLANSKISS